MTSEKFPSICSEISLASGLLLTASLVWASFSSVAVAQQLQRATSPISDFPLNLEGSAMPDEVASSSLESPLNRFPLNKGETSQSITQQTTDQLNTPPTPDQLREQLQIEPLLETNSFNAYSAGAGAGIPVAFGAEWGDVFITISGASKDRVRTTFIDSSISTGFGLGNPRDLVGVELAYNILSTRTQFAVNGSFDLKVHRQIVDSNNFLASTALGIANFYSYGPEASLNSSSVYGLLSGFTYLRPTDSYSPMPMTATLGIGGSPIFAKDGVGLIAGVGVGVHPQIGLGSSWNGTGFSLAADFLPFRNLPVSLSVVYQDIFNMTRPGHKLILSLDIFYRFR